MFRNSESQNLNNLIVEGKMGVACLANRHV